MMKKSLLIIAILAVAFSAKAQDQAIFQNYQNAPILINPGATGFNNASNLMANFRSQWSGFPGAPTTYSVNYHGAVSDNIGLGANVLGETAASLTRYRFQANFGYRFPLGSLAKMAIGVSPEFSTVRLSNEAVSNPLYEAGDVLIEEFTGGQQVIDITLGFLAEIKNRANLDPTSERRSGKTTIGLAFPNLLVARLNDIASSEPSSSPFRYFSMYVAHRVYINSQDISFEPSLLVRRIQDAPSTVDINVKAGFLQDVLVTGLSYRAGLEDGILGFMLGSEGFNINKNENPNPRFTLNAYYMFDLSFQEFQKYGGMSHEVTLVMQLRRKQNKNN